VLAQRAWLLGAAWQIGNQSRSVMPTLNDCLAMRINSAAGEPITSVIVLVNNMGIPERRWKTRLYEPVPKCRGCSPPSTTTCNSYAKDIHRNEMDQNIVNVIVTERHCHPQEVVVTAMAMRDRITCRFLCLRDRIAHRQSTPTRLYLQDLGHVVRGNRGRRGCGRATQRRACLGRAQGRRPGVPGPAGTSGRPSASGPRQRPWPSEWVAGQIARARALSERHGEIVAEFFDVGQSRSIPWKRRPQAALLLDALKNPQRGFEAVVIGEPQRAFYGNQYGLTFPVFVHYHVQLWVPEVGGKWEE
jgi:hypothetical protein